MKSVIIPDSERLTFHLMDDSDADLLWQLDQDEEVMRHINGGRMTSREDIQNIMLPRLNAYRNPEKGWGIWQVSNKADDTYLGWVLVRPMHFFNDERDDSNLELGWRFYRQYWGSGYATEAAKAIMNAVSVQTNINQFSAIAMKENDASINIMKKLGMTFDKRDVFEDPLIDNIVEYYSIKNYTASHL